MSDYRPKNEVGLMYIFFSGFLIISNLIASTVSEISGSSAIYRIISTVQILIACAVYGFVFIEGYTSAGRNKPTVGAFVKKLKRLFFPFVIAVAVYWIVMLILGDAELKPIALLKIAFGYHFYVVFVILQFYILSLFTDKIAKVTKPTLMVAISLVITLVSVTVLPTKVYKYSFTTYLVCYVIGYLAGSNTEALKLKAKNNFTGFVFLFVISLIITESISIIYAFSSSAIAVILKQVVSGLYNPVASVFILVLCTRLSSKSLCNTSVFEALSQSAYSVYLWHMLPIIAVSIILIEHEEMSEIGGFAIKALSTLLLTLIIVFFTGRKKGTKNGTV